MTVVRGFSSKRSASARRGVRQVVGASVDQDAPRMAWARLGQAQIGRRPAAVEDDRDAVERVVLRAANTAASTSP